MTAESLALLPCFRKPLTCVIKEAEQRKYEDAVRASFGETTFLNRIVKMMMTMMTSDSCEIMNISASVIFAFNDPLGKTVVSYVFDSSSTIHLTLDIFIFKHYCGDTFIQICSSTIKKTSYLMNIASGSCRYHLSPANYTGRNGPAADVDFSATDRRNPHRLVPTIANHSRHPRESFCSRSDQLLVRSS